MDLGFNETAILRGWLQGMPAETAVETFLPSYAGNAQSLVQELLEHLSLKARRVGKPEWAGLFSGPPSSTEAGQRKALTALDRLVHMEDPRPLPEHSVDLWLPKPLSDTCRERGLNTLSELIAGWQRLPKRSARLVEAWLVSEGLLDETSTLPVTVMPLERLNAPGDLDGSRGCNRAPGKPLIDAANDIEAVAAWLALWPEDSHTFRAYRREAERFVLWCVSERGKALSSITVEDLAAYRRFLHDPKPRERWIGPTRPRSSPDWRPFRAPLSKRSIRQAEVILGSLCQWLVDQRWLETNPFAALPRQRIASRIRVDHALTEVQWKFVLDFCDRRFKEASTPERRRNARRLKFVLSFAYLTGLRISEMASARIGDIEPVVRRHHTQYWLSVTGKGGRTRRVPLPEPLVKELVAYLQDRGWLVDHPEQAPKEVPVIAGVRRKTVVTRNGFSRNETAVTPLALHHLLRDFFREAGAEISKQDPASGKRIAEATAHWLRHTHGSHALDKGVPLTVVRDNLGHASIQTTSLYVHKKDDQRFDEIRKLAE